MSKKINFCFFGVCGILLILFTFLDLQFSKLVFDIESVYGKFFEAVGEIPGALIAAFCVLLLLKTRNREIKWKNILSFICYGFLFVSFIFMGAFMLVNYIELSYLWIILIAPIFAIGLFFISKFVDTKNRTMVIRIALIGLIAFLCALIIINILKVVWNRPRFRDMGYINNFEEFRIWLIPAAKGALTPDTFGIGQAYSSFPSGHVANSAVIIWLTLLPTIMPRLKNKEGLFSIIAFVWVALVAVSRVVMGAHFMTDTIIAVCIVMSSFILLKKAFHIKL